MNSGTKPIASESKSKVPRYTSFSDDSHHTKIGRHQHATGKMPRVIRAGTIVLFVSFLFALHYLLPTWHQPPLPDAYTSSSSFVSPHSPLSRSKNHAQASRDVVDVDSKGLTRFVPGKTSRHPIELLIDRAKVQAAQQEARIREVVTLEDAVEEYEMGFGMKPSRGFELW